MDTLRQHARDRILEGHLSYELYIHGSAYALEEFYRQFSEELELEYDSETVIHIVSFKNVKPTHHNREAIIDMIHNAVGESLWHGNWRTAIGRS